MAGMVGHRFYVSGDRLQHNRNIVAADKRPIRVVSRSDIPHLESKPFDIESHRVAQLFYDKKREDVVEIIH